MQLHGRENRPAGAEDQRDPREGRHRHKLERHVQQFRRPVLRDRVSSFSHFLPLFPFSFSHNSCCSIGVPSLISNAGRSVYNATRIGNVTVEIDTFTWDRRIDRQRVKLESGYKILVAAVDHRGCLGAQGSFTIKDEGETSSAKTIVHIFSHQSLR